MLSALKRKLARGRKPRSRPTPKNPKGAVAQQCPDCGRILLNARIISRGQVTDEHRGWCRDCVAFAREVEHRRLRERLRTRGPRQVLDDRKGYRDLLVATLTSAFERLDDPVVRIERGGKVTFSSGGDFANAVQWFQSSDGTDAPMSYKWLCAALGYNAQRGLDVVAQKCAERADRTEDTKYAWSVWSNFLGPRAG